MSERDVRVFLLCAFLLVFGMVAMGDLPVAAAERECPWKGRRPGASEWRDILRSHRIWLESDGRKGAQANLCEADLRGAQLKGAGLARANLWRADLSSSDLTACDFREAGLGYANLRKADLSGFVKFNGADLFYADLTEARLDGADFRGATIWNANFTKANLGGARLAGASLLGVNFTEAVLYSANFTGANLSRANFTGAELWQANLTSVVFEPSALPPPNSIALAKHLWTMRYARTPNALAVMREELKKGGFRRQERELTYALRRMYADLLWAQPRDYDDPPRERLGTLFDRAESVFNTVLFDWTVQYGMSPGRPLWIIAILVFCFAVPYSWALTRTRGGGIWAVALGDRVRKRAATRRPLVRVTVRTARVGSDRDAFAAAVAALRMTRIAVYFSLLSTFAIGWRDLNVGNWITRMQTREYTLRGTGWVRAMSGVQSIVSVYLLALWALSYFGRPFE